MKKAPNKPLYSIIGLIILVLIGYLFIYIEERKFEAHYYKTELEKLQPQSAAAALIQETASAAESGTPLATLWHSKQIASLGPDASTALITALKQDRSDDSRNQLATDNGLSLSEIDAISTLLQSPRQPAP